MPEKSTKYYWLKLKRDFFKRHDIRIIEDMENGKDYVLFYLKLLVESIDHQGQLRFSETIPYNEKMLSTITNTNVDIVRSAIKIFTELKMMCLLDDGTLYLEQVNSMTGSETKYAIDKRIYRRSKYLQIEDKPETNVDNVRQEKEKEKEKDSSAKPRKIFQKPCVEDVALYCLESNYNVDAGKFVAYYESNGWRVGRSAMKDWKASVRYWHSQNPSVDKSQKPIEKVKLNLNPEVYKNGN